MKKRIYLRGLLTFFVFALAFLNLTQMLSPRLTLKAAATTTGVRQGMLILHKSTLTTDVYHYPDKFAEMLGLPYEVVNVDTTDITNSTFYDADGNGKWTIIILWKDAATYINSTEKQYLDEYEQTFNVTEAGMCVYGFFGTEWRARFGVQSVGGVLTVYNWTFQKSNVRLEFQHPNGNNFTDINDMTLFSNVTHYIKGGNETCDKPVLWSYTDGNGVTRTVCSHRDSGPMWIHFYAWLPYVLALRLSSVNLLFHTFVSYDIHDMNMLHYGANMNLTNAQNYKTFYDEYGMVLNLVTNVMEDNYWYPGYDDFWNYVRNHPEAFDITQHQTTQTENYTAADLVKHWNFLSFYKDFDELPVTYIYHVCGTWFINATVAEEHYGAGIRFESQDYINNDWGPPQYYSAYSNMFLPSAVGYDTTKNTTQGMINDELNCDNYAQMIKRKLYEFDDRMRNVGYMNLFGHYPGFCNEEPMLNLLKDSLFTHQIFPNIGVTSYQTAFMARTIGRNGSYTINNPIYYPNDNLFEFKLTQDKDTPPDNICGIIVADPTANMDDSIMTMREKQATFFLFRYQSEKTYIIDLSKAPTEPYVKQTQGWLTTATYVENELSFTVSGPSDLSDTTQVYCGDKGEPTEITGATSWSYNSSTKICRITVTHSSAQEVKVDWTPPSVPEFPLGFAMQVALIPLILYVWWKRKRARAFRFVTRMMLVEWRNSCL